MGITKKDSQLLFYSKKELGVSFSETLMLGRLYLYATQAQIDKFASLYSNPKTTKDVSFQDEYSEPLFEILGASRVDSIDYSDYEKASIIHDLNLALPQNLHSTFTCIIDGGTIEHVFNFPIAIKNCMQALKVGGHYIGITPANNQMGHGFYQFSPELYYRIFSPENGFRIKKMLITPNDAENEWYEIADPAIVKSRVVLMNPVPLTLMMVAEKIQECEVFKSPPYQSDYTASWASALNTSARDQRGRLKALYQKLTPKRVRIIARNLYDIFSTKKFETQSLGAVNPEHFKNVII
jgi:hypothetical protein